MELHKRVGIVTVVVAVLLGLSGMVISTQICSSGSPFVQQLSTLVFYCQEIRFSLTDNPFDRFENPEWLWDDKVFALPVRHLLLFCLAAGAVGFLWIFDVLPVPFKKKPVRQSKESPN